MGLIWRTQLVFQFVKAHFSLEICEQARMSARYIQLTSPKTQRPLSFLNCESLDVLFII